MANKVFICGIDTSKLPRATNQELMALMQEIRAGNQDARDRFVMYNMRLVLSICGRFPTTKYNIDDVFQVGTVGLIKAIDNFNPEIGVRFSTYAVPMIIGEIRRFLRDSNSFKVTRGLRDIAYKALTVREELQKSSNDEPNLDDIANELNIPRSEVAMALDAISEPLSLYETVYNDDDGGFLVLDQIKDPTNEDSWLEKTALKDALLSLDDREREIVTMRYYSGKTQTEISSEIGISQAQVSRLEKNALKVIRNTL